MFSALLTLWLALPAPAPQSDGLTKTTITIDQTIEDVVGKQVFARFIFPRWQTPFPQDRCIEARSFFCCFCYPQPDTWGIRPRQN